MIKKSLLASLLCCIATLCHALPFEIVPQGVLPTTMRAGSAQIAVYTVTNNSGRVLTGNYVAYFPSLNGAVNSSQVLIDTSYPSLCGMEFTLQPNGSAGDSCTLELMITETVQWNAQNPKFNLMVCASDTTTCAGPSTTNALNVESTAYSQMAYIANYNTAPDLTYNTVSFCDVATDGTLTTCNQFSSSETFITPIDVILNDSNTLAYVANGSTTIDSILIKGYLSICPVNPDGTLTQDCGVYFNADDFDFSFTGLTFNADSSVLYATNCGANAVTICSVNTNGTINTCNNFTDPTSNTLACPDGRLALNLAETYAYVPNNGGTNTGSGQGTVSICPVINDTFGDCLPAFSDDTFQYPGGIDINAEGTYLYVANFGNFGSDSTISICPILSGGSMLGTCTATTPFAFGGNNSINLFTHGSTPFAYIPNGDNSTIAICSFNSNLSTCSNYPTPPATDFYFPNSVWIADF